MFLCNLIKIIIYEMAVVHFLNHPARNVKNRGDIYVIESSTINFSTDQTKTEGDIYQGYCELF